jgi:hypothetical protein
MSDQMKFESALSVQQKDWHFTFADQQDLVDYARGNINVDGLKSRVSTRLMVAVRAALECGMVR